MAQKVEEFKEQDKEYVANVRKILDDFSDLWPAELPNQPPPMRDVQHAIDLIPDASLPKKPKSLWSSCPTYTKEGCLEGYQIMSSMSSRKMFKAKYRVIYTHYQVHPNLGKLKQGFCTWITKDTTRL